MAVRFAVGTLVKHRRYPYRGVVAAFDETCRASDEWYWRNQSQPDRDQPWYHVLVHGSEHTTYAAEDSLDRYEGGEQVVHPLVKRLFASFGKGRYQLRPDARLAD